jgi:hypothetical protein
MIIHDPFTILVILLGIYALVITILALWYSGRVDSLKEDNQHLRELITVYRDDPGHRGEDSEIEYTARFISENLNDNEMIMFRIEESGGIITDPATGLEIAARISDQE